MISFCAFVRIMSLTFLIGILVSSPAFSETDADVVSTLNFPNGIVSDAVFSNDVQFTRGSPKTNYENGIDTPANIPQIVTTLLPSMRERIDLSEILTPKDILAMAIDKNGCVWGMDGPTNTLLYTIDPSKELKWRMVHDFSLSGNGKIHSMFVSQKSGYLFVAAGHQIFRSLAANGEDDLTLVLTLRNPGCWAARRSFTDAPDGRIWISEYGDKFDTELNGDAALTAYQSTSEGEPGSFTEVFNYRTVLPQNKDTRGHIHAVVWNTSNDTLYLSTGSGDPDYILKSQQGTGGNWVRINGPEGFKNRLCPSSGILLGNGDIVWGDDAVSPGLWLHHVADDSFEHVGFEGKPQAGGAKWANIYEMYSHDGILYVPSFPGQGVQDHFLIAAPEERLWDFRILDYFPVSHPKEMAGVTRIAGLANDGYLWFSSREKQKGKSLKYKPVKFKDCEGLAIDTGIKNRISDPFFDRGKGWSCTTPDCVQESGGKYKGYCALVRNRTRQFTSVRDSGKAGILSFWARRGTAKNAGVRATLSPGAGNAITFDVTIPYLDSYWRLYSFMVPAHDITPGVKSELSFTLTKRAAGFHYIDGIQLTQAPFPVFSLAQSRRSPERLQTRLPRPLTNPLTIVGIADVRFPLLDSSSYTIWESCDEDNKEYLNLGVQGGQITLRSPNGVLLKTASFPVQTLKNPHGDALYWALTWRPDYTACLSVATSRSDVETSCGIHLLPQGMNLVYDGNNRDASQALGGSIVSRKIIFRALSSDEIKAEWEFGNTQ